MKYLTQIFDKGDWKTEHKNIYTFGFSPFYVYHNFNLYK